MKTVVGQIMSAHPVAARVSSSYKELAGWLREYAISGFPVLADDGKVVGVVSESDMLAKEALDGQPDATRNRFSRLASRRQYRKAAASTAGELMSSPVVTVTPGDTIARAARLMHARGLRLEIAGHVIPRLSAPGWYSVVVRKGVVTLEGSPESARIGRGVVARARRVQGVVAVHDHLVYPPEPMVAAPVRGKIKNIHPNGPERTRQEPMRRPGVRPRGAGVPGGGARGLVLPG